MNKKTNLLLLFLLSFSIFSCEKEAVTTEPEAEALISDQVPVVVGLLKDVVMETIFSGLTNPELNGLQGQQGDTRSSCVTSVVTPGAGTAKTLVSTYASGTCAVPGSDQVNIKPTIDGILMAVFKTSVLTGLPGTKEDVSITLSPGFKINGYEIEILNDAAGNDIDNEIWLNQAGSGYNIFIPSEGIKVTKIGSSPVEATTFLGNGEALLIGFVGSSSSGSIPDVVTDPATYVDNDFTLRLDESVVKCEAGTTISYFCADTQGTLDLKPISCNCITRGLLRLRDLTSATDACSTTGVGENENTNSTQYDFAYAGPGSNSGACDNVVRRKTSVPFTDFVTIGVCN